MAIIIDFTERKAEKNRNNLIDKMREYFRIIMPRANETTVIAFAIASVEDRKNCGGLDELNNLTPIA